MLMPAEFRGYITRLYFWIFFRWGIIVSSFIIVGNVWHILGRGPFLLHRPPFLIHEQPRKGTSWIGLKDISFITKYLLVSSDSLVITRLVWVILGIYHPRDFWKFWNCTRFTGAISKFSKMHSADLSKIALQNIWLLLNINRNKMNEKQD